MDWKNNVWVGLGALILLIAGGYFVVDYLGGGGGGAAESQEGSGWTFLCESTGETFVVTRRERENYDTYKTYAGKVAVPVKCRACGGEDAYRAFYCPECEKYYKYTKRDEDMPAPICPEGHVIPTENQ